MKKPSGPDIVSTTLVTDANVVRTSREFVKGPRSAHDIVRKQDSCQRVHASAEKANNSEVSSKCATAIVGAHSAILTSI